MTEQNIDIQRVIEVVKENWHKKNLCANKSYTNRQKRQKKKKNSRKMKNQLGLDDLTKANAFTSFDNLIQTIKLYSGVKDMESLVHHIEAFAALCVSVMDASSISGIISAIIMYAKIHCKTSLIFSIREYLNELLLVQQGPGSDLINNVRDIKDNWSAIKSCANFSRISQLLGVVVSLGFCSLTNLDFSIAGFKLIDTKFIKVHESCIDIFDATLDSIAFLVDGAYECFRQRSLRPLLVDDLRAVEMDDEYNFIISAWSLIITGNAREQLDVDANEFDSRLEKLLGRMKFLLASLKGFDKKVLNDKIMKLLNIKNDFVTMQISSGVRRAPFTIEAFGESSQGKTTILDQLIDALLTSQELDTDKSRQATINASDKFMSTWKSDNLVAKLDDMCNTKCNFVEKAPTQWVIDLCNNEPFYAPKADLESKGKVFVKPEIVTISTNKKDLDAYTYSHCPYSIQRRPHLVVTVRAKDCFQRFVNGISCGIDHDKIAEYDRDHPNAIYDDIWDVDIERAIKPEELESIADYTPYIYKGKKMTNVSMQQLLEVSIYEFNKHRKHQFSIIDKMMRRRNDVELCGRITKEGRCINIKGMCPIHDTKYKPLPNSDPIARIIDDEDDNDDPFTNFNKMMDETMNCAQKQSRKRRHDKALKRMSQQFGLDAITESLQNNKLARWFQPELQTPKRCDGVLGSCYDKCKFDLRNAIDVYSHNTLWSLEKMTTSILYGAAIGYLNKLNCFSLIPPQLFNYFPLNKCLNYVVKTTSLDTIRRYQSYGTYACIGVTSLLLKTKKFGLASAMPIVWLGSQALISSGVEKTVREKLLERSDVIAPMVAKVKSEYGMKIIGGCCALGVLMLLRTAYKKYQAMETQGNIIDPSVDDIQDRDSETNPWAHLVSRPSDHSEKAKTTTVNQMQNIIDKNLMHALITYDDMVAKASVLFIRTNYFILPYHYINKQNTFKIEFLKQNPNCVGGRFQERVEPTNTYRIPNTDLGVIYCATGGSFKDLSPYLLNDFPWKHTFNMLYRQKSGQLLVGDGVAEKKYVNNEFCGFDGLLYKNLSFNTFDGLCGAVMYTTGNSTSITGFHVGGIAGEPVGCAAMLSKSDWDQAFNYFKGKNFTCQVGCEGNFRHTVLGKQIMLDDQNVPTKSPMKYLPENATIEYKGRCLGAITSNSNLVKTSMCHLVEEVLEKPCIYRQPKFKPEWWGWQTCLSNLAIPARSLPYHLVERSIEDYIKPLETLIQKEQWSMNLKPLNDQENLLGIPGCRFVDAIKKNTSIGAPLTGAKAKHMIQIESTEAYPHNFVLTDQIMEEINYYISEYKQGRRVYSLIKASKKDEAQTKEKCRIFYANSVALTWVIRKYYLPLIRFLQFNPTISECAVGINSESREWEQLHEYMTKYDNLFGGDYSKYDQKIPAQLLLSAFKILTRLASYCNYTEEELFIMQTLSADVVYAYIMFNGDLVSLISGTHISGNSLTVILNGIVGSLNLRCVFFHNNPNLIKFRDSCNMITYGDDNAGSVKNGVKFGIKTISKFLEEYGQTYTMPDKESELVEYIEPEDFDFLKRKTVYIPEIDCHVGALSEESIVKALYMRIPSKDSDLSEDLQNAMNIDGVLRDAFFHGREKFDQYKVKMRELAAKAGVTTKCTQLNLTFDMGVHNWKMNYDPEYAKAHEEKYTNSSDVFGIF